MASQNRGEIQAWGAAGTIRDSTLWSYQEKKPRLERGDTARLTAAACR